MRTTSGPIWDAIATGDFTGDNRYNAYVTVEEFWSISIDYSPGGAIPAEKLPIRWYRSTFNPPFETVVPNCKSIDWDRSIDQDAATCQLVFYNQAMVEAVSDDEIGQPGYFTPSRGEDGNRWGHESNDWDGVFVPNSLWRTYEGYGGLDKSLADALADGNVEPTGTWLVDKVVITTNGLIALQCRDMAKLLIDQIVYPPLVPSIHSYNYRRFTDWIVDTPRVDYGTNVGGVKKIVGGTYGPVIDDAAGNKDLGYWLVGDDGGVFAFGVSHFHGANINNPQHSVIGITGCSTGDLSTPDSATRGGYWTGRSDGILLHYGTAEDLGMPGPGAQPYVDIESPDLVTGYYFLDNIGTVHNFGTTHHGGTPTTPWPIVAMACVPDGSGYWLMNNHGQVYAYGSAPYDGNATLTGGHLAVDIASSVTGNGYVIVDNAGNVFAFGDATYWGGAGGLTLTDPITGIIQLPLDLGYWLVGEDGGVFAYGPYYYGSLVAPSHYDFPLDGNFTDTTDIIKDLLLWSGFWLEPNLDDDDLPVVYGNIELTGTYPTAGLDPSFFDKQPVIDVITKLKETVGAIFLIDEEGAVKFTSPNWWGPGNFLPDGTHTDFIPNIDETVDLLNYSTTLTDEPIRSSIIVSSEEPTQASTSVVTATVFPGDGGMLRGMVKTASFINDLFNSYLDSYIMAELIGMQLYFQLRTGSATCVGNPNLQLDDQAQLYERQTEEMFVHYLRGIHSSGDLETGQYTMNLTTHWLGLADDWTIVEPSGPEDPP